MKILKSKKIYLLIILVLIFGIMFYLLYLNKDNKVSATIEVNEEIIENDEVKEEVVNKLKVDIKGMVINPGVYEIDEGSRVIDVINLSGGLIEGADTSNLNLSKKLKDENVIFIGSIKEPEKIIEYVYQECNCPKYNDACISNNEVVNYQDSNDTSKIEEKSENTSNGLVSINNANIDELMSLPSIGEAKAKSIISYREENGGFSKIEDIMNVSGIGNALFEKIKDYISL